MFSLNDWMVKGKVMEITEKTRGYLISVKGVGLLKKF